MLNKAEELNRTAKELNRTAKEVKQKKTKT
jgi:hypothetical protein